MLNRVPSSKKTSIPLLASLVLLVLLAACSSNNAALDAGSTDLEQQADQLAPDLKPTPDAPPALKVGEFLDFTADDKGKIVGSTSVTGNEQFVVLLLSMDETARKTHAYSAQPSSSQPMRAPGSGGPGAGLPGHSNFVEKVNAILRSKPPALWAPKRWQAATLPPKVGDKREFKIDDANGVPVTITAECQLVDSVAAYWMDKTTTPLASISSTTLAQVADGFSKIAMPRLRAYFGKESDINGDGLIGVLFSPLVSSSGDAIAYVSPCDLLDPGVVYYCKHSNQMELLYIAPPYGTSPWSSNPKVLLETVSHEFQHAIYFYRKFIVHNKLTVENPYITEGLSGLAQDLSGYQMSNIWSAASALQGVNDISVPFLASNSITEYLPQPADSLLYGGGYLLMRYLFDRAGGDGLDEKGVPKDMGGMTWLHNMIDSTLMGMENLAASSGLSDADLMQQLWTTLVVSNRGPNSTPITSDDKLNYKPISTDPVTGRQRGFSPFGSIRGFPLKGPKTQFLSSADGTLRAGGAEYLIVSATPEQPRLGFIIQTPPEAKARVRLVRIQ